jgi:hypothetical protein
MEPQGVRKTNHRWVDSQGVQKTNHRKWILRVFKTHITAKWSPKVFKTHITAKWSPIVFKAHISANVRSKKNTKLLRLSEFQQSLRRVQLKSDYRHLLNSQNYEIFGNVDLLDSVLTVR